MCDVCCAGRAVEATTAGRSYRFVWNPEPAPSKLANNPDAPPLEDYTLTPSEWPFVLVRAESYEEHVEGKGRWKFGFSDDDMTEWFDSDHLSMDIDQLGVSWAWDFQSNELADLILQRSKTGVITYLTSS